MQTRSLISGQWISADSGKEFDVTDPATDELIARVPDCSRAEARRAIDAAAAALPSWRAQTANDRALFLRKFADLIRRDQERLALLMTREQGKPLAESRGEILYAASFIDWAAEEAKRIYGETIPATAPDKRIIIIRQPVGVTAAITPWNFPSAMITRKLGPALACGCTMVIKPAELTPLSAIALGELALEAGIPAGVVNIITGDAAPIGFEFCTNQTVRKLSFTGSTEVGKILMRQCADNLTRLSLELGGHAPLIVFDDADIDVTVDGVIASKFRNMGQTCICPNRIFVQKSIYENFVGALAKRVAALRVGRGTESNIQIGPLIENAAVEKVAAHVDDAQSKGAKILVGGKRLRPAANLTDRFFSPTILEGFTRDMLLSREETFGPVAPIQIFREEKEAIEAANDSEYGLASYIFARDASRLIRVAEALEYGIVGMNDGVPSTAQAPFGGVKHSGFGREGGHHVMNEYTSVKFLSWRISR